MVTQVVGQPIREVPEVVKLLERGKQQGLLTYDEINEALRSQVDPDQIEDIFNLFESEGIQLVEVARDRSTPTEAAWKLEIPTAGTPDASERPSAAASPTRSPVKLPGPAATAIRSSSA